MYIREVDEYSLEKIFQPKDLFGKEGAFFKKKDTVYLTM
jgi:hypothetical protein